MVSYIGHDGRFDRGANLFAIDRSCSEGCGFDSHCRPKSFHRDLILGLLLDAK